MQVRGEITSLDSSHCLLLQSPAAITIWQGAAAPPQPERTLAAAATVYTPQSVGRAERKFEQRSVTEADARREC